MARSTSAERARRLIALLSQLSTEGESGLSPLAQSLGITVDELAEDLTTLSMCGVAPYDPLGLVPVAVWGETFEVFGELPAVRGPVRLSVSEANALAAALQAAGFEADDPLPSKLLKAAAQASSAARLSESIRSTIEGHDTTVYQTLASAMEKGEVVEIEHSHAEEPAARCRSIEPVAMFAERGAWYVRAWCRSAESWRTFRLDRISSATATGEVFTAREGATRDDYRALEVDELPVARLHFSAGEDFDERDWPGGRVVETLEDGGAIAEVPHAGGSWLARRVAGRLGAVRVVEPESLREQTLAIARELLEQHAGG